ncbi:FAD-dependent oxidoreductase [Embleya sp. NPDC050154]|uniref:FAD-dependent oxidoreductase n=1 Tax=Embleya sp. NPDC050154 TaxID=3363988 RepID=UPI003797BE9D
MSSAFDARSGRLRPRAPFPTGPAHRRRRTRRAPDPHHRTSRGAARHRGNAVKAIVVGAGPIGCLMAKRLRDRAFEVDVYEKGPDPRLPASGSRRTYSFNLTLTLRGTGVLEPELRTMLESEGVRCGHRIVHHTDGTLSAHAYGSEPGHHLLSIPRHRVHHIMLDEAERAGARLHFGHECVRADARAGRAVFIAGGDHLVHGQAALLVGCDGAGSVVRHAMSRGGSRLDVHQEYITHGYIELRMPAGPRGQDILVESAMDPDLPAGLHVWPRGDHLLLAQPNRDHSYSASLFLPMSVDDLAVPSFRDLPTAADTERFFRTEFPDIARLFPGTALHFPHRPPASLRIIEAGRYHHGRAVLVGDAAHTMVPFYGQGINCGFEDAHVFFDILDRVRGRHTGDFVPETLAEFTAARVGPCHAISALSRAHLDTLADDTTDATFAHRNRVERLVQEAHPHDFTRLYESVAFSRIPYDRVVDTHDRGRRLLYELFRTFDAESQAERIVEEFGRRVGSSRPAELYNA